MKQASEVLAKLYRSMSREVNLTILDKNTKSILSNDYLQLSEFMGNNRNELGKYTVNKLLSKNLKDYELLKRLNSVGNDIKLENISTTHKSKYVKNMSYFLRKAYIGTIPIKERCPRWLSKFAMSDKKTLLSDYSGLVTLRHKILKFEKGEPAKKSNLPLIIDHYKEVLERSKFEKLNESLLHSLQKDRITRVDLSKKSKNHLNSIIPVHVEDDINKLNLLYTTMQRLVDVKSGYPSFDIYLYPTALGLPRVIPVQENKITRELKKFQDILNNYSLLRSEDLTYLESLYYDIPKNELKNRTLSIAVKVFLSETASVKDDASLETPKTMFRYNEPVSELISLYENVKEYSKTP